MRTKKPGRSGTTGRGVVVFESAKPNGADLKGQIENPQAAGRAEALSRSNSLTDLAARIRAEHEAAALAVKRGAEHAMNAGDLLIEAKAQLDHGQWLPWLRDHCSIPERTAQLYMRCAKNRAAIEESKSATVADLSLRGAMAALAPPDESEADDERMAEGAAIADSVRLATLRIVDVIIARLQSCRALALTFHELSPSDQRTLLVELRQLKHPFRRKRHIGRRDLRLWLNIDDRVIAKARGSVWREVWADPERAP